MYMNFQLHRSATHAKTGDRPAWILRSGLSTVPMVYKREPRYLAAIMHCDHGAITRPLRVNTLGN
jgi:hypothetical protein